MVPGLFRTMAAHASARDWSSGLFTDRGHGQDAHVTSRAWLATLCISPESAVKQSDTGFQPVRMAQDTPAHIAGLARNPGALHRGMRSQGDMGYRPVSPRDASARMVCEKSGLVP